MKENEIKCPKCGEQLYFEQILISRFEISGNLRMKHVEVVETDDWTISCEKGHIIYQGPTPEIFIENLKKEENYEKPKSKNKNKCRATKHKSKNRKR